MDVNVESAGLAARFPERPVSSVNPLAHFVDYFSDSTEFPDAERPRKRARLDEEQTPHLHTVTLDKKNLVLHLDPSLAPNPHASSSPENIPKVRCYLHSVVKDSTSSDTYTLTLEAKLSQANSRISIRCTKSIEATATFPFFLEGFLSHVGKPSQDSVIKPKPIWTECTLQPCASKTHDFELEVRLMLALQTSWIPHQKMLRPLLQDYLPDSLPSSTEPWSPQDFYNHVHVPDKSEPIIEGLQSPRVECELYPFQKRAVRWLLHREGVTLDEKNGIVTTSGREDDIRIRFNEHKDLHGERFYVCPLFGSAFEKPFELELSHINGGILSEEMGLGKTVELISLICLHQRPKVSAKTIYDTYTQAEVRPASGTLIITPPLILDQWRSEIGEHAPSLKVFHYKGLKNVKQEESNLVEMLLEADVVVTTFNVLASEMHYTKTIDKSLRHEKKFDARKSPLVQVSWWRVCLDEAQMIESGVSNAAKVARSIPRCNAWAVTGTPLRKNVNDLLGLLVFLRLEPLCQQRIWDRLVHVQKEELAQLCSRIALRHTKVKVHNELRLPPQKRIVITVPFTPIEEQYYSQAFDQMCDEVGLDRDGAPLREDWNPDSAATVERMRDWLYRLRQTCLHPHVGNRNRRVLGNRDGPLRTVDEVLDVMVDQNETAIRAEERLMLMAKATRGHVISFGKQTQRALDIYLDILNRSGEIVDDCRAELESEREKLRADGFHKEEPLVTNEFDFETMEAFDGKHSRLGTLKLRLRGALELQHIGAFFSATGYFQLKDNKDLTEPESDRFKDLETKESDLYQQAKTIRREILSEILGKTSKLMEQVRIDQEKSFGQLPLVEDSERPGGIETRRVMEKFEAVRRLLNRQSEKVQEWSSLLVKSLCSSLLDQDESELELTGEEYEQSTKLQDEQYVYIEVLKYAIADRHTLITGLQNALVKYESAEAYKTATKGRTVSDTETYMGPAPELMKSMIEERNTWVQKDDKSALSLRGVVSELRGLVGTLNFQATNRSTMEASLLEQEMRRMQKVFEEQNKALLDFHLYYDDFRSLMNTRLEFYKQLQHISDMVAPYQEEASDEVDEAKVASEQGKEQKHADKLAGLLTKRRFLSHLREESTGKQEQRICVICQSSFEIGVLVVCGHVYCKDCFRMWFNEHKNCPMCRRHLRVIDFHEITYAPRDMKVEEERPASTDGDTGSPDPSSKSSIYSQINTRTLSEIKNINLKESYGGKLDTIIRHVLWIRSNDPGAKSIVFSQYRDFLRALATVFEISKIGCVIFSEKNSIASFKEDPSIECFLLDAKSDSSGLNLVNATHVILCEPLINVAIELQAVARVHRIGQRSETTVWMYLVNETVEEAIYDISVSRRLQHIQQRDGSSGSRRSGTTTPALDNERALDAVHSLELQSAPIRKLLSAGSHGGEIVPKDDLWNCLFAKSRRKVVSVAVEEARRQMERELAASSAMDWRN